MANEEHLAILRQGVEAWNAWRREHPIAAADLHGADLRGANLNKADFLGTDLGGANLDEAYLGWVDLDGACLVGASFRRADISETYIGNADLSGARLEGANLRGTYFGGTCLREANLRGVNLAMANLSRADLSGANLSGAALRGTNLSSADLGGADLSEAMLFDTVLGDLDLSSCKGLDSCTHHGPSIIDHHTLQRSGPLPLVFLRGVGLPENLIDYLPSLLTQPIQFYSCFISYSSKDQAFAERLHADLQAKGVRCWFAPHDMRIGAKILDAIDEAIRLRDKVLLVLSKGAIASDWVEGEVTRALDEERERKRLLLFPISIDNAVWQTKEAWARLLRGQRNIGDFIRWKDHDAYRKGFDKLLRDLKVEMVGQSSAG